MIYSQGDNYFRNNRFNYWTWSAPILQTAEEVFAKIHELKIVGRVIKDIRSISQNYSFWLDDSYHEIFEAIQRNDDKALSALEFECSVEIDEPLLIQFEDGDVLGIDFSEGSSIRMDMNTLSWDILSAMDERNFHANRMFNDILGKRIDDIVVTSSLIEPHFTASHGLELDEQPSYLQTVSFCYLNGEENDINSTWRKLTFEADFDYGVVSLEEYSTVLTLPGQRIKDVIEGYFTPNDLKDYLPSDNSDSF
ncbi:MAG: hypothetical protein IKZ46_06055 [Victivallales bacterium]|nr:hypothetical protein [Victivallales bacterium]